MTGTIVERQNEKQNMRRKLGTEEEKTDIWKRECFWLWRELRVALNEHNN